MARTFNGSTSNYLTASAGGGVVEPLTMACWFRTSDLTTNQTLISYGNNGAAGYWRIMAQGAAAGDPVTAQKQADSAASSSTSTSTGYSANTWHHAAGVFVSNTSRGVYIDGGSVGAAGDTVADPTADFVSIGVLRRDGVIQPMNGTVAWPCIWDVALNASEIAALARGVHPLLIRPHEIIEFWDMSGDAGAASLISGGTSLTETGTVGVAENRLVSLGWPIAVTRQAAGGGAAVEFAGVAQSESSHSAALAVARSFAAILLSESAANAALAVVRAYAGSLISESEASATFAVLRALAGDAISVSDSSAALTVEGVSAVTFAGISASESLTTGELAALRSLLGTSASESALSASLTVEGANQVVFAGQSLSESVMAAALAVLRDIAGTSTSDTDASAAAAVLRSLVGQSISESLLSGSLSRAAQSAFAGMLASESFLSGSLITDAVAIATALQRVIAIRADDRTITVH